MGKGEGKGEDKGDDTGKGEDKGDDTGKGERTIHGVIALSQGPSTAIRHGMRRSTYEDDAGTSFLLLMGCRQGRDCHRIILRRCKGEILLWIPDSQYHI